MDNQKHAQNLFNGIDLKDFSERLRNKVVNATSGADGRMFVKLQRGGSICIVEEGTKLRFKDSNQIVTREVEGIEDMLSMKIAKEQKD